MGPELRSDFRSRFEFSLLSLIREAECMLFELIRYQGEGKGERVDRTHLGGLLIECEKADLLPDELLSRLRELSNERNRMLHSETTSEASAGSRSEFWEKTVSELKKFVK